MKALLPSIQITVSRHFSKFIKVPSGWPMHTFCIFFNGTCEVLTNTILIRGLGYFPWHVCGIWWDLVWFCDEVLLWLDPRILSGPGDGRPVPHDGACHVHFAWWRDSLAVSEWRVVFGAVTPDRCFFKGYPSLHRHSSCRPTAAAAAAAFTSQRRGCCTIC